MQRTDELLHVRCPHVRRLRGDVSGCYRDATTTSRARVDRTKLVFRSRRSLPHGAVRSALDRAAGILQNDTIPARVTSLSSGCGEALHCCESDPKTFEARARIGELQARFECCLRRMISLHRRPAPCQRVPCSNAPGQRGGSQASGILPGLTGPIPSGTVRDRALHRPGRNKGAMTSDRSGELR